MKRPLKIGVLGGRVGGGGGDVTRRYCNMIALFLVAFVDKYLMSVLGASASWAQSSKKIMLVPFPG